MPVLPVLNGYALRVSNLLRELSVTWRVTLAAPIGEVSRTEIERLGVERIVPVEQFRGWDTVLTTDDREGIRRLMERLIAEEAPQAAIIWAGAEVALLETPRFPPAVVDRLDCELLMAWRSMRAARSTKDRLRAVRDGLLFARNERRIVRAAAAIAVDGETDARVLRWLSGRNTVHVVPNGIRMQPIAEANEESATPTVAFTGNLAYTANVDAVQWFVERVWPTVRERVPRARLIVAGRDPDPQILSLASAPGVEIARDVPDILEVLRSAWLSVAPMRTGSGLRTKIVEAWSVGRPVVMSRVAASGLRRDPAGATIVANNAGHMASHIVRLLDDHDERRRLGAAAHALAVRDFGDWRRAGERMSGLLQSVSAGGLRTA